MSSKVVKWFKRQASIRRHSDKADEKSPSSSLANGKPEEKRKSSFSSFPRLSFRKRNKRKGSEIEGGLSIIGISKKFSLSIPKEMESHSKQNALTDPRVPTSHSTNFSGSISLTNSPCKTDEYRSISSEFSSFDNLKNNDVDESITSNIDSSNNKCNESESRKIFGITRLSNYDNDPSYSESKSNTSLNNLYDNTKHENAPLAKMEEICDAYSDKEYPEEIPSDSLNDVSLDIAGSNCKHESENATVSVSLVGTTEEILDSVDENKIENKIINVSPSETSEEKNDILYDNLEVQGTKEKCDRTVLFIKEERDSSDVNFDHNRKEEKELNDVFKEIDRLVKDATSINDFEIIEMSNPNKSDDSNGGASEEEICTYPKESKTEEAYQKHDSKCIENGNQIVSSNKPDEVGKNEGDNILGECQNVSPQKLSDNVENNLRNSNEDLSVLSTDDSSLSCLPTISVIIVDGATCDKGQGSLDNTYKIKANHESEALQSSETEEIESLELKEENNNLIEDSETEIQLNVTESFDLKEENNFIENSQAKIQLNVTENFDLKEENNLIENCEAEIQLNVTESLDLKEENNNLIEDSDAEIQLNITEKADFDKGENINIKYEDQSVLKDNSNSRGSDDESTIPSAQVTLKKSSPIENNEEHKICEEKSRKSSVNYYPKELNPFGEEEEDSEFPIAVNKKYLNNSEGSPKENSTRIIRENGLSSTQSDTIKKSFTARRNMRSSSSSPLLKNSYCEEEQQSKACYNKSLNPFGESEDDDEASSSMNSSNPFGEDDNENDPPHKGWKGEVPRPRLPPKMSDFQNRKSNRGSLPPIPHPRRSKQSHHGSYTSLQNVSVVPVPAPRSITAFGSMKTLNYPLNPFDDGDEDNVGDFERRGIGRSSLQVLPLASTSEEPLVRIGVRGSLPPSSKIKFNKKKRQAPLPPGISENKPPPSQYPFGSIPRKRSSISSSSDGFRYERKTSFSREESPQKMAPPRPPPPKISY